MQDHFTPFGARATPPVIVLPRRPSRLYRALAVISPLLWAAAIIIVLHLAVATGSALALMEHQLAMDARV
ncbi:hypothetical protein P6U16_08525 [Rhizobium sp. 32-5/1]|uniref:hypothetical protein n=1 Tax=Rhizobium sp. 32-5/1 TaxID=3019602 RepID=UPI00240E7724|nr:hypothetical protein [Rhizobium sp. 32-5/1]WEZ84603.1 hypothetical protein P6U16_08525 [Rhizobium sp. 32-5/1]